MAEKSRSENEARSQRRKAKKLRFSSSIGEFNNRGELRRGVSPVILVYRARADSTCRRSGFEPVGTTAVVLGSRRCSWRLVVRPYHHGTSFSRLRRGSCAHAGAQAVLCRYLREGIRVSLLPPSHPRFYSDRLGFIVSTRYILSSR